MELLNSPLIVPVFLGPAVCYSGLAGANDNHNCLSSGWVKLQGGVEIPFDQRACVVVWVVSSCGERTRNKRLLRHTELPPERTKAETERSVYLRWEQVSAHRASECFDFKLKPRRNPELGVVVVVFAEGVGFVSLYAACCVEVNLSRGLQMYSMGSSHDEVLISVSLVCGR